MASGQNLWVWLQCIGVASGVVVRRYIYILIIIINFPYSTCIKSFFGSSILTSLFIFKCFFGLYYIYLAGRSQASRETTDLTASLYQRCRVHTTHYSLGGHYSPVNTVSTGRHYSLGGGGNYSLVNTVRGDIIHR